MNAKERVKAAVNKKTVDKIPLGFYAVDHDIISKVIGRPTYIRNKPLLQLALWEGRRDEIVESMKVDVVDFYKKIDCADLLTFKEAPIMPPSGFKPEDVPKKIDDKTYHDKNGVWKLEPEANDIAYIPDKKSNEIREYFVDEFSDRNITKPNPSCFELLEHLIENFGKDKYIAGYSAGLTAITLLGGTEAGLMTMALQPDIIKACNEQRSFCQNAQDKYYILPGVDGVMVEQDMAGTNGPLISPEMFKELCFPYYRERIRNIKKYVPQVILHNCGNNLPLMDMLIEGGIDAYESIQTTSKMSLETLTGHYGDRLCIWGAVALEVLISGTVSDVKREVRRCFDEAREAKGFILGPSHSIAFGTKYENFMTMLDEFEKLR